LLGSNVLLTPVSRLFYGDLSHVYTPPLAEWGCICIISNEDELRDQRKRKRDFPGKLYLASNEKFDMTLQEFRNSLGRDEPSDNLSFALAGLWWDAKSDWTRAHESAQQDEGPSGAWGHAYLHRKEGDDSNAGYWYRRASRRASRTCLDSEWAEITEALLRAGNAR
jgi:hypothetical protein